jgi:hypothetical protein
MSGRKRSASPDQAETIYVAALHSVEALRDQLRLIGLEDADLEDAELVREDLLAEVERLRREGASG